MDGFKKRLRDSISLRLSFWLSLAIIFVAVVAGIFSFTTAYKEAHEFQDDMLRQIAALFVKPNLPAPHTDDSGRLQGSDEEARVIVEYLATKGEPQIGKHLNVPAALSDGIYTLEAHKELYRVLIKTTSSGERIAVAQETALRDEIASHSALRTIMPFLILVPLLLFIVRKLIRNIFSPIAMVALEIDLRDPNALHAVDEQRLPLEIRPFANAVNRMLMRVKQSMEMQRRFIADAAHELRSPMTALSLQAERLADTEMSSVARQRLASLRQGMERARNLLEQLLAFARAQSPSQQIAESMVSLSRIYQRVLEDLMPLAEEKNIDVGIIASEHDILIRMAEIDLITLLKNLIDNAIRYSPPGGRVDVSMLTAPGMVQLKVVDTGPGISESERARVFDPFYRVLGSDQIGSGLGLSIVKTIADRIGAKVRLSFANNEARSGLCVTVSIRKIEWSYG